MDRKKIMALARELALPEPVLGPLERAAERLPSDLPIEALAAPDTAAAAWTAASARLPGWREDGGMAQLAAALAAACRTRMLCREAGVPEEVFSGTMGCFARFLKETRELTGLWAFDRGFWTWRQTGGLLFRLGTLEFEYRRLEEGEQPPPGLNAGDGILSVHIPSDALLTREELDRSYDWAARFFTGEGGRFCPGGKPRAVLCGSWLLAPALDVEVRGPDAGAVQIDHGIFLTVAENLIGNAARFARQKLEITLAPEEAALLLSVADDGPGFSPELLKSGPKPFGRTEESGEHFGMGLYGSGLLCRKHGGGLRLENRAEGGGIATASLKINGTS